MHLDILLLQGKIQRAASWYYSGATGCTWDLALQHRNVKVHAHLLNTPGGLAAIQPVVAARLNNCMEAWPAGRKQWQLATTPCSLCSLAVTKAV